MEFKYVIINFIILVAVLVLVGRKTVKRLFGGRYERINEELDRAEEIEKMPMPFLETPSAESLAVDCSEETDKAESLVPDGRQMLVIPNEIDLLTERASRLIALSLNAAMQDRFTLEELVELM